MTGLKGASQIESLTWIDERRNALTDQLIELSRINSGSSNIAGLERMLRAMQIIFHPLGGEEAVVDLEPVERISDGGERTVVAVGRALSIRKRPTAPIRVLLAGHMDTVFPEDHPFQDPERPSDELLVGPGVADLKGGLLVMRTALEALERSPWADRLGWEVLLNSDEEIGSPGSAPLLERCARRNHLGLLYEPALPDGALAGARKGSGNFTFVFHGRAAHAGREHHLGRNAVRALADFVRAVDDLNGQREGLTVNPAFIRGGGATNVVPDRALLRLNVRLAGPDDEAWFDARVREIASDIEGRDGFEVLRFGGFSRKPKPMTPDTEGLFRMVADCGDALGIPITWRPTGGCCDGNNLAAAGLPNVDTLGVVGGKIHSDEEYMEIDSLVSRSKLSALLLLGLASGERQWPIRQPA